MLGAVQSGYVGTSYAYRRTAGVREALDALEYPLTSGLKSVSEIQEELEEERDFYQSFIAKLERLQGNTEEAGKVNGAADAADDADAAENIDLMQLIRERMAEIFEMVKNGDTEQSFQIGNSSFTIKEWERFLEKFDSAEDAIRELMKEEAEKRAEKAEQEEELEKLAEESEQGRISESI